MSLLLGHTSVRTAERYVTLALDALKAAHAEHSVLALVQGLQPAMVLQELLEAELPPAVRDFPVYVDGALTLLMLVADRRPAHVTTTSGPGRPTGAVSRAAGSGRCVPWARTCR